MHFSQDFIGDDVGKPTVMLFNAYFPLCTSFEVEQYIYLCFLMICHLCLRSTICPTKWCENTVINPRDSRRRREWARAFVPIKSLTELNHRHCCWTSSGFRPMLLVTGKSNPEQRQWWASAYISHPACWQSISKGLLCKFCDFLERPCTFVAEIVIRLQH